MPPHIPSLTKSNFDPEYVRESSQMTSNGAKNSGSMKKNGDESKTSASGKDQVAHKR